MLVEADERPISTASVPTGNRPAFCAPLASLLRRIFTYPAALGAGLVAVTVLTMTARFDDPDVWLHLKLGEAVWQTHTIPSSDLFSFTAAGHAWTAHEWLSELSMYAAYKFGGYVGLMLWASIAASLIFLLVYALCWMLTKNALSSFRGGMVAWCFGTVGLGVRPLLLGHLFLAAEMLILEAARTRRRRYLWLLPPLFAVWVNCHASYVFGIAILVIYLGSSFFKKDFGLCEAEAWDPRTQRLLGLILALSSIALLANPVGARLWLYPFETLFHQSTAMNAVQEWLPPNLREGRTLAMLGVVAAVLLLSLVRKSSLSVRELLLLFVASALALRHMRMMFLFGIVISPVLCRFSWGRDSKRTYPAMNALIIFGCLAAIIWKFPNNAGIERQIEKFSPVGAVNYIREKHLAGPMLNEYGFGGYLMWSLPQNKVFIHGLTDVFDPSGVLDAYLRWANLGEDPKLLLDKYGIQFCLLSADSSIGRVLPYLPGWRRIYSDDVAAIYSRTPPLDRAPQKESQF